MCPQVSRISHILLWWNSRLRQRCREHACEHRGFLYYSVLLIGTNIPLKTSTRSNMLRKCTSMNCKNICIWFHWSYSLSFNTFWLSWPFFPTWSPLQQWKKHLKCPTSFLVGHVSQLWTQVSLQNRNRTLFQHRAVQSNVWWVFGLFLDKLTVIIPTNCRLLIVVNLSGVQSELLWVKVSDPN